MVRLQRDRIGTGKGEPWAAFIRQFCTSCNMRKLWSACPLETYCLYAVAMTNVHRYEIFNLHCSPYSVTTIKNIYFTV